LTKDKSNISKVPGKPKNKILPFIFINEIPIGGLQEIQALIDEEKLEEIFEKLYERLCRNCYSKRESLSQNICKYC